MPSQTLIISYKKTTSTQLFNTLYSEDDIEIRAVHT